LVSNCQSSTDASQTQSSAVEVESSVFNKDHLTVLKPHGQTFSVPSSGVPGNRPSMTKKHGRPLSVHCRQRLLVKGFTYSEKCKRLGKMASGCMIADRNGYSKKACVISEIVSSLKSHNQESPGVQTCVQPQKRVADISMLNDEDMSQLRDGQEVEHQWNSGDTDFRLTTVCQNANDVVSDSVYTDAVVVQGLGLPQKIHVASASLTGEDTLLMRKYGFPPDGVKTAVVRKRGRPRKRPLDGASLSNHGTSGAVNSVPVKRRGRPRKISAEASSSLIVENMSEVTKSGQEEECPCQGDIEAGKSDGLKQANQTVLSSTDTNTVIRKRGRPRKIPAENNSSLIAESMSEVTKSPCESGIEVGKSDVLKKVNDAVINSSDTNTVVRRRGRPRKRPVEAASLSDEKMSVMGKDGFHEHHNTNAAVVQRQELPYKTVRGFVIK